MVPHFFKTIFFLTISFFYFSKTSGQAFEITGKVVDAKTQQPVKNSTIHLRGGDNNTLSKEDGSFVLEASTWNNVLEVTCIGYKELTFTLQKNKTAGLILPMEVEAETLEEVIVTSDKRDKEPGLRYMKKVIANKPFNNPARFKSYNYQQYTRHELDISHLDSLTNYGKGLKSMVIRIYRNTDPQNKRSSSLPLYFSETVSNKYHNVSPNIDRENILAKKTLGLETDKILWQFDKFNFNFNIYDNWFTIFNQTYASPLSNTAFNYYNFYFNDSSIVNGRKVYKIHFTPKKYENAFAGTLWINDSTYSIKKIEMHLSRTADLNYISDIHYNEEYRLSLDSGTNKYEYMPYKYSSIVEFQTGLALLGIPVPSSSQMVRLEAINTIVIGNIKINADVPDEEAMKKMKKEQTADLEKPETFWEQNRLDTLSQHEKSIYLMVDSLKKNRRYIWSSKLITFIGTGYWDFGNKVRLGPNSSFLSNNTIEGWRSRIGLMTLPGFNKKIILNGYIAYGFQDQRVKGNLGIQYLWNGAKWTKTSLSASSDYDYLIQDDDELDQDNLISSYLKKSVPSTLVYTKKISLKHEQYISKSFSAIGSFSYKELKPVFNFSYHPLSKTTNQPIDTIFATTLPVAEASIGLRFAKDEKNIVFNDEQIHLYTYKPVFTANFTYGLELGEARFTYQKINVGVEQRLRLPPKSLLYYKLQAGKTFGTAPYLLLDVPVGNEYYVSSKYLFNTMIPYEFATDEFVSLLSRFYLGGYFFDKIPFIKKLHWRERFSFNAYQGTMSTVNKNYNKQSTFSVPDSEPFMEGGVGIENIFHVFSIDYYQRLSGLNKQNIRRGGIFMGVNITF